MHLRKWNLHTSRAYPNHAQRNSDPCADKQYWVGDVHPTIHLVVAVVKQVSGAIQVVENRAIHHHRRRHLLSMGVQRLIKEMEMVHSTVQVVVVVMRLPCRKIVDAVMDLVLGEHYHVMTTNTMNY